MDIWLIVDSVHERTVSELFAEIDATSTTGAPERRAPKFLQNQGLALTGRSGLRKTA
jgi:hypothetical protein